MQQFRFYCDCLFAKPSLKHRFVRVATAMRNKKGDLSVQAIAGSLAVGMISIKLFPGWNARLHAQRGYFVIHGNKNQRCAWQKCNYKCFTTQQPGKHRAVGGVMSKMLCNMPTKIRLTKKKLKH
jgi:hypothetical protein